MLVLKIKKKASYILITKIFTSHFLFPHYDYLAQQESRLNCIQTTEIIPEGCLSLQLTAIYIFSSSQHLTAKVQEGLITNGERIGQISVFTTFIRVAAEPQERERSQEAPKPSRRSVQTPLARGKKQHQNVPKSKALGWDGL